MEGFNQNQPVKSANNMPLAIIGTIIGVCSPCCIGFIVGIVAIVFSTQVNSKYAAEDYTGSESAAKNARILSFVALGLGVIGLIISIIKIQSAGGIDAYMQQIQDMVEQYQ